MTASRKQKQRKVAAPAKRRARKSAKTMTMVAQPSANSAMVPTSQFTMTQQGGVVRIRGHEFLTNAVKRTLDFLAAVYDMNPATWNGSRLVNIARSYEVYRYNRVTLRYVPTVATSTAGSVGFGFETDPNEPLPATGNFYQRTLTNAYSTLGPVWSGGVTSYNRPREETRWWYCSMEDAERRQTSQLTAFAVTNSPASEIGFLVAEYDIEFMYPELENLIQTENFDNTITVSASPALSVLDPITVTFDNSQDLRLVETIFSGSGAFVGQLRQGGADFNLTPGQTLFWAFVDGVAWRAFRTLEGARIGANPILTRVPQAVGWLNALFKCRAISRSFSAY